MKTKLFDTVKALVEPGSRIVAAVSGGSDSAALVHILHCLSKTMPLSLYAVHFNHGLRGEESDGDEAWTKAFCASLGVVCITRRLEVAEYAQSRGMATEEAARILRYDALEEIGDRLGADYIATAHTRDDRAETILLNVIRGTGLGGLYPLPAKRGRFLRPLTGFAKSELQEYLRDNHIAFRTDSTNLTDFCRRNRLRNTVIPILKEHFNQGLETSLFNLAEIAENANEYILRETRRFLEENPSPCP